MDNEPTPQKSESYLYNFTHEKAGMQGLDRSKIDQIIHDASVDSEFYKRQQERSKQTEEKVKQMQNDINAAMERGPLFISEMIQEISEKLDEIEQERNLIETWVHIDMDMFYASVEIRDNPELADKPIAVGGNSMIATANYIARKYGIRSAMPGFIGKKLCPSLIFVSPNFSKYSEEGHKIREIFRAYDPDFESMGLDEGNLRVTDVLNAREMNNPQGRQDLAMEIRQKIFEKTSLNASAGIACNKVLAKIATDLGKPNGQHYVPFEKSAIIEFMKSLNVRKIPGIGKVLEQMLNLLGVTTCDDIITKILELYLGFQQSTFDFLIRAALGIGPTQHPETREDQKSISVSRSFRPIDNLAEITEKIQEFSVDISNQLIESDSYTKCISVSIKTYKFEPRVKSETIGRYVNKESEIFEVAMRLFREMNIKEKIRLIGVRVSSLMYGKPAVIDNLLASKPVETSGTVKIFDQKCPICQNIFNYTEKRMDVHLNQCLNNQSYKNDTKPQKKIKSSQTPSVTLDMFYKKK